MAVLVSPRADEPEPRHPEVREEPGDGVRVAVHPAAGGEDRALDRRVVLVDRAVLPVAVATLVGEPDGEGQGALLQARLPLPAPVGTRDLRVGRPGQAGEEGRAPVEGVVEEAPAHVVHVVRVAVVGRAVGDDRRERRRPEGRDLEGVEPAPGAADHADLAGAPGLGRDPRDQGLAVVELLRRVLVVHQPVGVAGAAHVDAEARVPVAGEVAVHRVVAGAGRVALAVRQVRQDRRHRAVLRPFREPQARRHAVAGAPGRDPDVLDLANAAGERLDDPHGRDRQPTRAARARRAASTTTFMAMMCSGPVAQQPPTIWAPIAIHS